MTTYLLLNLIFLTTLFFLLPKTLSRPSRAFWVTLVSVVGLTAMFDPLIIALGMVDYQESLILGIKFFGAPVEDFFYAIYAAIAVPLLWHKFTPRKDTHAGKTL